MHCEGSSVRSRPGPPIQEKQQRTHSILVNIEVRTSGDDIEGTGIASLVVRFVGNGGPATSLISLCRMHTKQSSN